MSYDPAFAREQKLRLYASQKGRCASCGYHQNFSMMGRHHVIPRKAGGPNDDANIALICQECHDKCHSRWRDERHDALKPILMAKGCTPEQRSQVYRLYRLVGVRSDNMRHLRNQLMPVSRLEYARFEDDGWGGAIR